MAQKKNDTTKSTKRKNGADAKKKNLPLEPTNWEQLARVTAKVVATPKEVAALAK